MIDEVLNQYRQLFRSLDKLPQAALEVGALPTRHGILTCDELKDVPKKMGINLRESGTFAGLHVISGDARNMPFDDNSFDLVVCSSTLEHIPDFWLACDEMKRILALGGTLIINAPGFVETAIGNKVRKLAFKLNMPDLIKRSTLTFRVHEAPNDYYRFSLHCFHDIVMKGLDSVTVWNTMSPPIIFGRGKKMSD